MKIVIVGATSVAVTTAEALISANYDAVIIERDKERIDALKDRLDVGFINGDGTKPAILREAGPAEGDLLLCMTNNDQANILASLVGRSLGFERIVTKIEDPEFEHICRELGLGDVIIPDRNTAQSLVDMVTGRLAEDFAAFFKADVRLFSFVVTDDESGPVGELELPEKTRPIMIYRGEELVLPDAETALKKNDEVVLVTRSDQLEKLDQRWRRNEPVPGDDG